MAFNRVGVVGAGIMGSGISQVSALSGFETIFVEESQPLLTRGVERIEASLKVGVERGKLTEDEMRGAMSRLTGTVELEDLATSDIVVEAVTEDLTLKNRIFTELDRMCPSTCILASNTSSLSITELAAATKRSDRVVGLHFFNPVPVMKLVEVVPGLRTSEETVGIACGFAEKLGKKVVRAQDTPGFIVNLLLVPYLLDAVRALERSAGTVEDIDRAMVLGCGHPMGPLTLLDFVGLDTTYYIADILFGEFREQRYAPPILLKRKVMAGELGRKAGKGFYDYPSPSSGG